MMSSDRAARSWGRVAADVFLIAGGVTLTLALALVGTDALGAARPVTLSGAKVRVVISGEGPNSRETVQFRDGDTWKSSLETPGSVIRVKNLAGTQAVCTVRGARRAGSGIVVNGACDEFPYERKIHLGPDGDMISVSVKLGGGGSSARVLSVEDRLTFAPQVRHTSTPVRGPLDFVWSQNIKHAQDDLIAHWGFKSPAVMFQQGDAFAAMVPRIDLLSAESLQRAPTALDLDVTSSDQAWFSYGAVSSKPEGHSYFVRVNDVPLSRGAVEYAYWIVTGPQPDRLGYQRVTHLLWQEFGGPNLKSTVDLQRNVNRPELFLFDSWRQEAWKRYAPDKFWDYDCGAGQRCAGISSNRNPWGHWSDEPKKDAWFNAWFQTLRSAYGWYLYGRREHDAGTEQRAEEVLNLALKSPQQGGLFSTIYIADTNTWLHDDGWAGYPSDYHTFCMSWTGYWMMRWATDLTPDRKQDVLTFLRPYADFLLKAQQPSGVIPSWIQADFTPRAEFRDFNAETAGSALFLAEFSAFAHDKRYLQAAIKAQNFIAENVVPRERWYDFETFLSCARKPYAFFDRWTAQYPQNNLSTIQAAKAYLRLYELTGEAKYLSAGQQVLDYLLLTQQVWNHPLLTPKLIGGTTTQNTDAEWSDARECYLATLLFDYYRKTDNQDYLERSVAAARSGLSVAPWENWAHNGFNNEHGALTGFHWGTGSEMTSVEMLSDSLGDAFINAKQGNGVCFDGCTLQDLGVTGNKVSLTIRTEGKPRDLLIRFAGLNAGTAYRLVVNGRQFPNLSGEELLRSGYRIHL